jgi:hypothetical protein
LKKRENAQLGKDSFNFFLLNFNLSESNPF